MIPVVLPYRFVRWAQIKGWNQKGLVCQFCALAVQMAQKAQKKKKKKHLQDSQPLCKTLPAFWHSWGDVWRNWVQLTFCLVAGTGVEQLFHKFLCFQIAKNLIRKLVCSMGDKQVVSFCSYLNWLTLQDRPEQKPSLQLVYQPQCFCFKKCCLFACQLWFVMVQVQKVKVMLDRNTSLWCFCSHALNIPATVMEGIAFSVR